MYALGRAPGHLYEGDAARQLPAGELLGKDFPRENSDEIAESTLRLSASERDDGSELRGEVVNLALEVARVLGKEHDCHTF